MKVCPECSEPVKPAVITPKGWVLKVDAERLRWRHMDGTPLCCVVTDSGYQPALPVDA